jgi:hypothetical protein
MLLTSPRFRREPELLAVAAGHGVLRRGSRGRHVHLVQMALLDLGYALPISTASIEYSPDGRYGPETESVVRAFQRSVPGLFPDGVVGRLTMRALDRSHPKFTHQINLHFRSLFLTKKVSFAILLWNSERAYAQYGIAMRMASGVSLGLSEKDRVDFGVIKQDCEWEMNEGHFAELHRLGPPFPQSDVGVFIVDTFADQGPSGCGGHAANRPACTVTSNCRPWDVAHEVGHVLLTRNFIPSHTRDRGNLMFAESLYGATPPTLTEKQLARIRRSPLCHPV